MEVSGQLHALAALTPLPPPGKRLAQWKSKKSLPPAGNQTLVVQLVA